MKRVLSIFVFVFSVTSVGASCNNPTPTPPVVKDSSDCPVACAKMRSLGCHQAEDVRGADGVIVTCEQFCQIEEDQNNVELNPSCIKGITSCDQIESTCMVGPKN